MPQQPIENTQNNFTAGLKTEYTSLNFPENAATDVDNCVFSLVGSVSRRLGFDYEDNYTVISHTGINKAITSYKWDNVLGDGKTQFVVLQIGVVLYFYLSSSVTSSTSLSRSYTTNSINLQDFQVSGNSSDLETSECQYSNGNGYLVVYHPNCNPIQAFYHEKLGVVKPSAIDIKIRDFNGITESITDPSYRPNVLSGEHLYNLTNQGWSSGTSWSFDAATTGLTVLYQKGLQSVYVGSGLSIANGDAIKIGFYGNPAYARGEMSGTVVSYAGDYVSVNITDIVEDRWFHGLAIGPYVIWAVNHGYVDTWYGAIGNFPSNSDVWFRYKDATGAFNPAATFGNVSANNGNAPKGHYIVDAFNIQRSTASSITNLTPIVTNKRPSTGAWFQGRVWYTGVNSSVPDEGNADPYSWAENIYFSKIVESPAELGSCYQVNDPTSETLFDILPSDGGVIKVSGSGQIYKLFPVQNGMIIFAANGIWFLTGSQGIGFSANDYTLTLISEVKCISSTSFVNVNGYPFFWNEEGIYTITPAQQGLGLTVTPLTVDTILSYYEEIPSVSKKYARGVYDPIEYTIKWLYKSTVETDVTDRYKFDKVMVFNVKNKAFYTYTVKGQVNLKGLIYVSNPGGSNSPDPVIKYITATADPSYPTSFLFSFAEEKDDSYFDWKSVDGIGTDYESYFITGYRVHGQGIRKFQAPYIYVYSNSDTVTAYKIQGLWDYSDSGNSGKWTTIQLVTNALSRFSKMFRKHKIRGRGMSLQFKVSSQTGLNFDIEGWAVREAQNAGV